MLLVASSVSAADAELTNYKTGIDVTFSGTRGTDFAEEYLYHDKLISDRKVVYIKSATLISMAHNARNTACAKAPVAVGVNGLDGTPASGDEGTIRYRWDRDMQWKYVWATNANLLPAYTAPFALEDLEYETGVPVLGTTGPVGGVSVTNRADYYYRGMLDAYGDEWHVLAVADDDQWLVAYNNPGDEWLASDGKLIHFVVDPLTPCITLRSNAPTAQFYTTPPKTYFVPKIHTQISYVTDGVNIDLVDIMGADVRYRLNGGEWTTNAAPSIPSAGLNSGTNVLEYASGSSVVVKSRTIVRNPAFPSAAEAHGNMLWGTTNELARVYSRFTREPYLWTYNALKADDFYNKRSLLPDLMQGNRVFTETSLVNAFTGLKEGMDVIPYAVYSYGTAAKMMLLDGRFGIDEVGWELNHNGSALPSREINFEGYYIVNPIFSDVFAYDILIASFRSDQVTGGITPVEDHFIRDNFASFVVQAMQVSGNWQSGGVYTDPGMWGTARNIAALAISLVMPSYYTSHFGTSGFDGNTNTWTGIPFPDQALTWKQVFSDNDAELLGYPNLATRFGIEEWNFNLDGEFLDRAPYFSYGLMGHCFFLAANLNMIHLGLRYPNFEKAALRAVNGTFAATEGDPEEGPFLFSCLTILNQNFSDIALVGVPLAQSVDDSDVNADNRISNDGVFGLVWYDDESGPIIRTARATNARVGTITFK